MSRFAILCAVLCAFPATAQTTWTLADLCASDFRAKVDAEMDDPANSFCNLLEQGGERALRQLNKMVRRARRLENPNRLYFSPRLHPNAFLQVAGQGVDNAGLSHHTGMIVGRCSTVGHSVFYYSDEWFEAEFLVFPQAAYAEECGASGTDIKPGGGFVVSLGRHTGVDRIVADTPDDVVALFTSFHDVAVARKCRELAVEGVNIRCAVPGEEPDAVFNITLLPVPYEPTGDLPSPETTDAMNAAAAEWERIIQEGFPTEHDIRIPSLRWRDTPVHTDVVEVAEVDDLLIAYYEDPTKTNSVGTTYSWDHLMSDMPRGTGRRSHASMIRFSPSRMKGLRAAWRVKLAIHEIGHAIFLNYPSREFNAHGGRWDESGDAWIGLKGTAAYRASGGALANPPMKNGVHWPWNFLEATTSGGDIMESRINSHAELGAVTRGALRDFGYMIEDRVPDYQPETPLPGDPPRVLFHCEEIAGGFTTFDVAP